MTNIIFIYILSLHYIGLLNLTYDWCPQLGLCGNTGLKCKYFLTSRNYFNVFSSCIWINFITIIKQIWNISAGYYKTVSASIIPKQFFTDTQMEAEEVFIAKSQSKGWFQNPGVPIHFWIYVYSPAVWWNALTQLKTYLQSLKHSTSCFHKTLFHLKFVSGIIVERCQLQIFFRLCLKWT